jgi:neutral ceramidase
MKRIATLLLASAALPGAQFRAGVGRVDITPQESIWLSGYAARTKPSQGVATRLWAKALALEDGKSRTVIVTTDLIGLPRVITDVVSARVQKQYGLDRARLLFNSSHTHTGPVVRPNLILMYDLDAEQQQRVNRYADRLTEDLVTVIGAALGDLAPARLSYGQGQAGFAVNRRQPDKGGIRIGVNPQGPVDHSVPVLKVSAPDGKLRAVLFGYACHNTTLTAEHLQISGDYAAWAQSAIEQANPGSTALFLQLCGGDQNPHPRSKFELAEQHGRTLGSEVLRVLETKLEPVNPPVRAAYKLTQLEFAPHSREQFEKDLADKNVWVVRRAKDMLRHYDAGTPIRRTPYPVQAIRLGNQVTLLALGGEVVIDYALRAKREYGGKQHLIVAGYSNDVMCYIPSLRVLKEGGYEAVTSMIYYGQPGPFNEQVEELVFDAVRDVMARIGLKKR